MKNTKSLVTIGIIVVGIVALLYGLAKLGTNGPGGVTESELTAPVTLSDRIKGKVDAPVTLVEYSDFQCPACRSLEPTLKRLASDFDEELRIVYRHFPLRSIHANAELAAQAAEAAHLQGRFWEYHGMLFNTQEQWSEEKNPESKFVEFAKSLSMNEEQFKKDMYSDFVKDKVKTDASSADDMNISSTPTFFLNGKLFPIPNTYEGFSAAVIEQLILTGNNNVTSTTK